jgi:hypothetical protein
MDRDGYGYDPTSDCEALGLTKQIWPPLFYPQSLHRMRAISV